jgi:ribonuclease HI
MYFNGSLNIDGTWAGVYFISPSRDKLSYVLRIHFKASNNTTKYEATIHGLRIAVELGIKRCMVFGDSALVIRQVNKDWDYTSEKMDAYCAQIRKLENKFYGLEFHHMLWADNQAADELSKLGSTRAEIPHRVFVQDLIKPSIEEEEKPVVEKLLANWSPRFRPAVATGENHSYGISRLQMFPMTKSRWSALSGVASTMYSSRGRLCVRM